MQDFLLPNQNDRVSTGPSGLPSFKSMAYKAGKTPKNYADVSEEKEKSMIESGSIGFTIWDNENKISKPVPVGTTLVLLGHYWKLGTFTGKDKDAIRYTSNMVTDIKNHKLTVYANGNRTDHVGYYSDLKTKGIWSNETKIGLFWMMMDYNSGELYSVELSNTVKNGFKTATLKAYGQNVTASSIEKESVFSFAGKDDVFHVFVYEGVQRVSEKGTPYKDEPDMYFAPTFKCRVIKGDTSQVKAALEAKKSFFDVLDARNSAAFEQKKSDAYAGGTSELPEVKKDPFDETTDIPF